MTKIYWLSFCDGEQFLGACIVEAPDTIAAVKLAHEKKCNPGGQVMAVGIDITADELAHAAPFLNRLLTRAECIAFDAHMSGSAEGKVIEAKDFDEKLQPDMLCETRNKETPP